MNKRPLPPGFSKMTDAEKTEKVFWPLYKDMCAMRRKTGSTQKAFDQFKAKHGHMGFFPEGQELLNTNGTEPEFRFHMWYKHKDRDKYAKSNNCYAFALGDIRREKGDGSHGYLGQKCQSNSNVGPLNNVMTTEAMRKKMTNLILCDIRDSYSQKAYVLKDKHEVPRKGFHRMVAMFDKQSNNTRRNDYHYARETACGLFIHKSGWFQKPKFHDSNGQLIFDPEKATWNWGTGINYNIIAGWFAVPNRRTRRPVPAPARPKICVDKELLLRGLRALKGLEKQRQPSQATLRALRKIAHKYRETAKKHPNPSQRTLRALRKIAQQYRRTAKTTRTPTRKLLMPPQGGRPPSSSWSLW